MDNKKFQIVFTAILSLLISFLVGGYSIFLSTKNNYWFIYIGSYFVTEGIFIFISLFIKDEYKKMKTLGVFQIINVIAMMCYLLVMILWNDEGNMIFMNSYYVFGAAILMKFVLYLINSGSMRYDYNVTLHTYRNNDFISLSYLVVILELIIFKNFYPTTNFPGDLYVYIVEATTNAIFTILASFFALSTAIRSDTHEPVSPKQKIKYTIAWFNDHEVSFFISLIFSSYLATMAFANMKYGWFFFFLGFYYVGMSLIRFINYAWHRKIKKKCGDNIVRDNRLSSFILLFNAAIFAIFSIIISISVAIIMSDKVSAETNLYMFLFFIIPLALFRFISSISSAKKYRRERNTYKLGLSYTSLIASFFSVLEIVAIAVYSWVTWAKVVLIVLSVLLVHIGVIVMCIVFVVQFIRSLIVNRRSRENV